MWKKVKKATVGLLPTPRKLVHYARRKMAYYKPSYLLFSHFFGLFIISYAWSVFACADSYFIAIFLMLICTILSLGLILQSFWPYYLANYFAVYWYFCVGFCLVFTPSFICLVTNVSDIALLNFALSCILLSCLVDATTCAFLNVLGIGTTLLIYHIYALHSSSESLLHVLGSFSNFYRIVYAYFVANLIGILFCRRKEKELTYTSNALSIFGREILHRTSNIVGVSHSYASMLDICFNAIKIKKDEEEGKVVLTMEPAVYEEIKSNIKAMLATHRTGQEVIRRLVASKKSKIRVEDFMHYEALPCLKDAFATYVRLNDNDNVYGIPVLQENNNFTFWGSEKHLEQAIVNLIGYSYAHMPRNTSRQLWLKDNKIYYEYKGKGISMKELPYLFSYPKNIHKHKINSYVGIGGGIGSLHYVRKVVESFGGDIICDTSTKPKNSYTRFVIHLPN